MSDANVRKLIMNELSDLQLKRKMEKMNAEAAEKKLGRAPKSQKKKGRRRTEK